MAAAMALPLLPVKSFRDRLLDLASEHEALQRHVQILESQGRAHGIQAPAYRTSSEATAASIELQLESTPREETPNVALAAQQARFRLPAHPANQSSYSIDTGRTDAKAVMEEADSPGLRTPVAASTRVVSNVTAAPQAQRMKAKAAKRRSSQREKTHQRKEADDVWAILDSRKIGSISATDMVALLTALLSGKDCHIFRSEADTEAFMAEIAEKFSGKESDCLTKDNFMHVMLDDPLPTFGVDLADKVMMFRDSMVSLKLSHLVVSRAHIVNGDGGDVLGIVQGQKKTLARQCLDWLDPFVMFVIILNAVMIGMSYDIEPDSRVWDALEFGFTAFFFIELVIKLIDKGFVEHCFGRDWHWNFFDAVLVLLALGDCVVTIVAMAIDDDDLESDLSHLTLLRIGRLLRISRLLRLLRSKLFRELSLMVNGLLYGLRTILWAIILLVVVSYCLALLLRQMTDGDDSLSELFETVPVSMFTVYRCFIGDCSTDDGLPLAHRLYEKFGWAFTVFYMLSTMVITFGLFNLIMAIFVESTLANAKVEERKRRMNVTVEKLRVAKKIHTLVVGIMRAPTTPNHEMTRQGLRLFWHKLRDWMWPQDEFANQRLVRDGITRENFERAMLEPDMQAILEDDLDVSFEDTGKIFDALDANGDGALQIMELVEGLMSLRGPADKLDMLETVSAVRNIQVELTELKEAQRSMRNASTS